MRTLNVIANPGVVDPVCGMTVDPQAATSLHYNGATYYFCCAHCLETFRRDPQATHASALNASAVTKAAPGSEYTCPMHPEIVRAGPGTCPICGMALEPITFSEKEENPELLDMTRRFWLSLALTAPLFLIAMSDLWPGQPLELLLSLQALGWLELALASPVYCGVGGRSCARWQSLRRTQSEHVHADWSRCGRAPVRACWPNCSRRHYRFAIGSVPVLFRRPQ